MLRTEDEQRTEIKVGEMEEECEKTYIFELKKMWTLEGFCLSADGILWNFEVILRQMWPIFTINAPLMFLFIKDLYVTWTSYWGLVVNAFFI